MQEGATAARGMVEDPLDALRHLVEGEPVAVEGRHVQELDAVVSQRLRIVSRLEAAVHDRGDTAMFEPLDLALTEGPADRYPRGDIRIVELLRLQIGQPLHEPRQHAQPDPAQRPAEGGRDGFAVLRVRERVVVYQMPSSALASSDAWMRGSQRGVHTRLMSTSWTAG